MTSPAEGAAAGPGRGGQVGSVPLDWEQGTRRYTQPPDGRRRVTSQQWKPLLSFKGDAKASTERPLCGSKPNPYNSDLERRPKQQWQGQ